MSVDERSPKRQRRSYSPPSPPTSKPAFVAQQPHTPPPSVHMSPTWNAHTSSLHQGGGVAFPTPPGTSGYQGHMTGREPSSEGGVESAKSTPVDSAGMARKDGDGDVSMAGDADAENRRTDHDRSMNTPPAVALPGLFKLPTKPIAPQRPHPSQDLLGLYDLRAIQASVQRKDPVTGEKINKLRKSYEGKLKDLNLEGRNKATESKRELEGLVDPAWDMMTQNNISLWQEQNPNADMDGPAKNDIFANLDAALSFKPGRLPKSEHERWRHQLGLDDAGMKTGSSASLAPPRTVASNLLKATNGLVARASAPASPRIAGGRPERTSKKRRYDDRSYEGYEDDGYSTGEVDDRSAGKRRKRVDLA